MDEVKKLPWNWKAQGNYSQIFAANGTLVASDMEEADAKHIVECANREHQFQSELKPATYNAYPFVVETLQREGSCPRYRVSRHRGGGVYSDEFLEKKDAEFARHTLEREEANNERLRYRIWQLEQLQAALVTSVEELLSIDDGIDDLVMPNEMRERALATLEKAKG